MGKTFEELIEAAESDTRKHAITDESPPAYSFCESEEFISSGNEDYDGIVKECHSVLLECINEKGWQQCFTAKEIMDKARKGPGLVRRLMTKWTHFPRKFAIDIVVTTLADWVLFINDSGSMKWDGGRRLKQLREIGNRLAFMAEYCDDDGFQLRAFTTDLSHVRKTGDSEPLQEKCKNEEDFMTLYNNIRFKYTTPLGSMTATKIHRPMIQAKIEKKNFDKPVSVWYITDGSPEPEKHDVMFRTCARTYKMLEETKWGIGGLLNMMVLAAPVKTAVEFALELDNDKRWDPSFDMVLPMEQWIEMMDRRHPELDLNFHAWLTKTFVGHFLEKWDVKDPTQSEIDDLCPEDH